MNCSMRVLGMRPVRGLGLSIPSSRTTTLKLSLCVFIWLQCSTSWNRPNRYWRRRRYSRRTCLVRMFQGVFDLPLVFVDAIPEGLPEHLPPVRLLRFLFVFVFTVLALALLLVHVDALSSLYPEIGDFSRMGVAATRNRHGIIPTRVRRDHSAEQPEFCFDLFTAIPWRVAHVSRCSKRGVSKRGPQNWRNNGRPQQI